MVRNVLFLILGIFLGWIGSCVYNPIEKPLERIVVKTDTLVNDVVVKVPEPRIIIKQRTDTLVKTITNERLVEIYRVDTLGDNFIYANLYKDSIQGKDYKLNYEIETLGELLSFKPQITTYNRTETVFKTKPTKWLVSGAISTRGNFKFGVGYKGWFVDTELSDGFEQIFVGYQYQF